MSAIVNLQERREIKNLEAAVRSRTIGSNVIDRSDYFFARSKDEQRFKDVPMERTAPLRTWLDDIFAGAKVIVGVVILWGLADVFAKAVM